MNQIITDKPDPDPSTTIDTVAPVGLRVAANLEGEFDEEEYEARNMRRVVPLLNRGSNYYVVLFHNESGATELAVQQQDFLLCSMASSLIDHLSNIREGLVRVNALGDGSFTEDFWSS